jgi:hypothetical protein
LTLDDDVYAQLEREARRSGKSLKETANRLLRLGLHFGQEPGGTRRFKVRPRDLGLRPGYSIDSIAGLLDAAEGPESR